jgi:hypothetical protein
MNDLLSVPDAAPAIGMVGIFVCIAVIAVGCTIAVQWRKARQVEVEAALKKEMIERGMSADDVVKVLGASSRAEYEASQAMELAKEGMSADDIVKILKAGSPTADVRG